MKKSKLNLLYILMFMFLYSCSVPKFYSEINEMQKNNNYEIKKNSETVISIKTQSYDMNKLVFNKLKKELIKTNHIIYLYSSDSFTSKKYWFIIYDVENNIYYNIENKDNNPKNIEIVEVNNDLKDNYYRFIFDNFLENKCEILKQRGNIKLSGVRTYKAIYEVNLETKKNKSCYFRNFLYLE